MLFNSALFVFGFLPVFLATFALAGRIAGARAALGVLLLASLVFYGWWKPVLLPLLAGSILGNYLLAGALRRSRRKRRWLVGGLAANLLLLGWFKYAGLLAASGAALLGLPAPALGILLPLGISFFTFQQGMSCHCFHCRFRRFPARFTEASFTTAASDNVRWFTASV